LDSVTLLCVSVSFQSSQNQILRPIDKSQMVRLRGMFPSTQKATDLGIPDGKQQKCHALCFQQSASQKAVAGVD
jgi:hypothetical protein